MDGGRNGLTGQHARESVEQETRRERDPVPTPPLHTMVVTVGERMLQLKHVTVTLVKVIKSKLQRKMTNKATPRQFKTNHSI